MAKEPWERDPTGLFYVPPGNVYGGACLFGCGLFIGWVALSILASMLFSPQVGFVVAVLLFLAFWFKDR